MMKKIFYIFIILAFNACSLKYQQYIINIEDSESEKKIKTQGFYYSELESDIYLHYKDKYELDSIDKSKKIRLKQILGLYLSPKGTIKMSDGPIHGIKGNIFYNYDLYKDCGHNYENSTENAKAIFECNLSKSKPISKSAKYYQKRQFKIVGDTIIIQYYSYKYGFYLVEKKGIVHNDSSFTLNEFYNYKTKKKKIISEYYKFQFSDKL